MWCQGTVCSCSVAEVFFMFLVAGSNWVPHYSALIMLLKVYSNIPALWLNGDFKPSVTCGCGSHLYICMFEKKACNYRPLAAVQHLLRLLLLLHHETKLGSWLVFAALSKYMPLSLWGWLTVYFSLQPDHFFKTLKLLYSYNYIHHILEHSEYLNCSF